MQIERLSRDTDVRARFKALGVESAGVAIMAQKSASRLFFIRDLHVGAANILKQDALSIGADLAVPGGTILAATPRVDAILIATERQLETLSKKERAQPFGLKTLAAELSAHLHGHRPGPVSVMGVLNANEDSFFEGSRFRPEQTISKAEAMIEAGAQILDIGAVSSRPGSAPVSAEVELERLRPVVDALYAQRVHERVRLSVDTYAPSVAAYALERGFSIVNDITGLADDELCRICASYGATAVIMHMQGSPQTMQHDPVYDSLIGEIEAFFVSRIEKAERFGLRELVLDVGIGFGKRLEHNLALIAQLEHFLKLGRPLLVGASRKSMIDAIVPAPPEARLPGTLALHLKAMEHGAEILRVHDVEAHVQAIRVHEALGNV